jgi:hypothetical protein
MFTIRVMSKPTAGDTGSWLALVASLPTEDPAARMRVLRTLESLGAATMREGPFLMPESAAARQGLERLAGYVAKNGGVAQVLGVVAVSAEQQEAFRRLFDRTARYAELVKVVESLKVGFGVTDPGGLARVLHKQRRELEAIAALDFFPGEARHRAQAALEAAEAEVRRLMFPTQQQGAGRETEPLLARTWTTRRPAYADRLACAWLIRRFIDPEGRLVWLDKGQTSPEGAVGFAFEGARYANSASRVTFEEMLLRFDLAKDAALGKIGSIVHYLEVKDAPVPEAAGVETLLQGAQRRATSDAELLAEAEKTFDLLYDAYLDSQR